MSTFAEIKQAIAARGGLFTRASQAWDYEGRAYGAGAIRLVPMRGILLEGGRTRVTTSIDSWATLTNVTRTVNCGYGAFTVYDLTPNTTSGSHSATGPSFAFTAQDYCFRALAAPRGYDKLFARTNGFTTNVGRQYDMDAYTETTYAGLTAPTVYGVREMWGGWSDCWFSVNPGGTGTGTYQIFPNSSGTYAGTGTDKVSCWYAAVENGPYPTSPMLAGSRSDEHLQFSFAAGERYNSGTIAVGFWIDHIAPGAPDRIVWCGMDLSNGEEYSIRIGGAVGDEVRLITPAGAISMGSCLVGAPNKAALRFNATSANAALNGVVATEVAQTTTVLVYVEYWGAYWNASQPLNGYFRSFKRSNTLTDAELIAKTT